MVTLLEHKMGHVSMIAAIKARTAATFSNFGVYVEKVLGLAECSHLLSEVPMLKLNCLS